MSIKQTIKGTLKVFFRLTKEDWKAMDHKLVRIASLAVGFTVAALFWFFVFRNFSPFGF